MKDLIITARYMLVRTIMQICLSAMDMKFVGMVVLSTGLRPPSAVRELADKFGVKLNEHGFADTQGFSPVETSAPGVYVCGPFAGPKDIPETVMEASAAAAASGQIL